MYPKKKKVNRFLRLLINIFSFFMDVDVNTCFSITCVGVEYHRIFVARVLCRAVRGYCREVRGYCREVRGNCREVRSY